MEERIYLRALEIDDYKISIKWRKDDQIWNMLGGPKYFVSEAYEKSGWKILYLIQRMLS